MSGSREITSRMRWLIRLRIWVGKRFRIHELHVTIFWAALTGLIGVWSSIGFREATDGLHTFFTGSTEGFVASFSHMPAWRRIFVPTGGGVLAGLTLYFGSRLKGQGNSTDYMEAVVLGNGNLSIRASLVKSLSAWFSGASGGSIGREGPLVQLSSLAASMIGRWLDFPIARKRQIVACGAAAGIASAYNAPVAGAFFVAEIVLGSMAMESFGPLVISSVVAALTTRAHDGAGAIYSAPVFSMHENRELLPYMALGIACGVLAPLFLTFLKSSELTFARLRLPAWARLGCGGLIVGLLALVHPEVAGNGRSLVFGILHHQGTWQALLVILLFKVAATGATFGSGAVGGVFTPTLFTGSALGYLFGVGASSVFPHWNLDPGVFGLVGMGAFLAASTGAPVMAIVMLFELTLNYQMLIPVMLASVFAYYVCRSITTRSLYGEALIRKGAGIVSRHLATLRLQDLLQTDKGTLESTASFSDVAKHFLQTRHEFVHITEGGHLIGAIALQDIRPYMDQRELESLLIAKDLVREKHPRLQPRNTLAEALEIFGDTDLDRLPVVDENGVMLGMVSRTDVLLFLSGRSKSPSVSDEKSSSAL